MKKDAVLFGVSFVLVSGLLYTLERLRVTVQWTGEVQTGEYLVKPAAPSFFDNLFVPLFFLTGIVLLIVAIMTPGEKK